MHKLLQSQWDSTTTTTTKRKSVSRTGKHTFRESQEKNVVSVCETGCVCEILKSQSNEAFICSVHAGSITVFPWVQLSALPWSLSPWMIHCYTHTRKQKPQAFIAWSLSLPLTHFSSFYTHLSHTHSVSTLSELKGLLSSLWLSFITNKVILRVDSASSTLSLVISNHPSYAAYYRLFGCRRREPLQTPA